MNDYIKLLAEAKEAIKSPSTFVDENYVLKASFFVSKCRIENIDDAFLVFASHNYLNFAAKQEGYKKLIGYFFKSKLSNAIRKSLEKNLDIKFFLDKDKGMDILYVSFNGFIFSFHNPTIDADLKDKLNNKVEFDFVYKQKCAALIFKYAMKSDILSLDISSFAKSKYED